MAQLTNIEKLWLPSFIVFLQAIMLILFGVLVDYEDTAAPVDSTVHGSDGEIATFYPCTLMIVLQWLAWIVGQ